MGETLYARQKASFPQRTRKTKIDKVLLYRMLHHQSITLYGQLIIALIVTSLALGIMSTIDGYKESWVPHARIILEIFLLVVFASEFALRIWSSGAHGTYGAAGGWKKYLATPHMIIDMFVILSSTGVVITLFVDVSKEAERALHLLQLLRILRIDRQIGAFSTFWKVFKRHRKELLTCWYMCDLTIVFISFLVYAFEEKKDDSHEDNLFNGVYRGVISLTTIGYGYISPETPAGKIIICCFAIFGTFFFAIPAGIIGSGFALQVNEQQKEKHAKRRRRPAAVLIQSYWRKYAAKRDLKATWTPHIKGREDRWQRARCGHFDSVYSNFPTLVSKIASQEASVKYANGNIHLEKEITDEERQKALWYPRQKLNKAEKLALSFTRFLKTIAASKNFKQARRPYDERDILDQFAASQVETFAKLRELRLRIESSNRKQKSERSAIVTKVANLQSYHFKLEQSVATLAKGIEANNDLLKKLLEGKDK